MMGNRRWKILCGVLAATTVYAWSRGPGERAAAAPPPDIHVQGYRALRVSAAAIGKSTQEIVEELLASHSMTEMRRLCDQLGATGDDTAIDAVTRLIADPRPGVPGMVITAIGTIGTDHAVEVLEGLSDDARADIKYDSIYALGTTGNPKAETFLVNLAKRGDTAAISALGDLATDHAVEVLYKIASTGADETVKTAITTLGSVDTPAAVAALARLIDSPSVDIASKALAAIQNVDDAMLAKLSAIVKSDEVALAKPAALAIAHAGDAAIPILRSLALEATSSEVRIAAVQALGTIQADAVVTTLGALVDSDDADLAREATRALAQIDAPEARDILINAALSDRAEVTAAVDALVTMQGPEIDQALLEIAKGKLYGADRALASMLRREHPEALELAVALAGTGTVDERFAALSLLADAGTDAATTTLIELVRGEHGELRTRALDIVTRSRPGDPQVMEILRESLHGGDADERRAAATALGRVGSDDARDALVSALSSSDADLRSTALGALAAYRLDDSACSAIRSAALSDPDLLPEGMRRLLQAGSSQGLELARTALSGEPNLAIRTLGYLAEMNPPGAGPLIVQAARAGDDRVRMNALRTLGQTHAPEALDIATNALHDGSYRVRETAASTLSGVGGDRARDALIQLSRSGDPNDRITALSYLPDDPVALNRTRELLRDSDSSVVWSAMRSLASTPSGAPALRALVRDASRSDDQRYDAATMLENYGRIDDATAAYLAQVRARSQYGYSD